MNAAAFIIIYLPFILKDLSNSIRIGKEEGEGVD